MNKVSICICTKNRPEGLEKLLLSIFNIRTYDNNLNISITIVENNLKQQVESLVRELQIISPFKIRYFLEPNIGISSARNRAIRESNDSDFCVFTDDDQIVDKEWLVELIKCQREFNADGVYGLNPPIFKNDVPRYISSFFSKKYITYGTELKCAATGCLLLKTSTLENYSLKFDERLNYLGGEDVLLTSQLVSCGGKIINNSNAIAFELIPKERATVKYIIKRTFRNSITHITVSKYLKVGEIILLQELFTALVKIVYGVIILLPYYLFGSDNKLKGLTMVARNVGILYSLFGKTISFY